MSIPGSASPLFLSAAAAAAPAAFQIDRSLRFNSADSAYLDRTPSSAGNRRTWTWSGWVKKTSNGAYQSLFTATQSGLETLLWFDNSDHLNFYNWISGYAGRKITTAVFRDPSAWYHIVIAWDSTNSTAADRVRLYVNGTRITDFSTSTDPALSEQTTLNDAISNQIGSYSSAQYLLNGYLADVHFIDGQALAASDFGEYDDNNVWQPKAYSGTYGTNGFHLDFSDNSSNAALGYDAAGSNDWTVNNLVAEQPTTLPAVSFDGTGDYLSVGDSSDYAFGTGDYTVECFVYHKTSGAQETYFSDPYAETSGVYFYKTAGGNIGLYYTSAIVTGSIGLSTNKWHHVAVCRSSGTSRLFVDGVLDASASDSANLTTTAYSIGDSASTSSGGMNGFISNLRVIKGTALYTSSFTPPTAPLTNVTNTKLLCCQSSSSATAATVAPGTITANGDAFATEFSDSTSANDSLIDTPTNYDDGTNVGGNYATWNPLENTGITFSNGNLDSARSVNSWVSSKATIGAASGKYYFEYTINSGSSYQMVGVHKTDVKVPNAGGTGYISSTASGWVYQTDGNLSNSGSFTSTGISSSAGDVIMVAFDVDAGKVWFGRNGTWFSSGDPATGANASYSNLSGRISPATSIYGSQTGSVNFGQRPFAYAPPTGYKSLCTTNLADPTIADGSTAFDAKLYTGNGSTQTVSGYNFSPDLVWLKSRSNAVEGPLFDTVRGANKGVFSSLTNAEFDSSQTLNQFNSDGYQMGGNAHTNFSNYTYVGWAWDGGTSTVSNTDGSLTASVRANQSTGFSIATFTDLASGSGNRTWGHGLNAAPEFIVMKARGGTSNWMVYHAGYGTGYAFLNSTNAFTSSGQWNGVTSTTAGHNGGLSAGAYTTVCYHWAPVEGYSNAFTFTGTGTDPGPFVYLGFRPALLVIKRTDSSNAASHWRMIDMTINPYNVADTVLYANSSAAELTEIYGEYDALSNGFRVMTSDSNQNASGSSYVGFAWAEHPFKTARAR